MGYLITHIAACLVFAQLLGLLLGWLLWGYLARQRAIEVQSLRERLADMQVMAPRMAFAGDQHPALAEPAMATISAPADEIGARPRPVDSKSSFRGEIAESAPKARSVEDELEAEVKEARLQHYEKQLRELEGVRDRLPLLQADLSNAIAGRRAAENRLDEIKTDYEVRVNNLMGQVRDFERAAHEWDRTRDEFEHSSLAKERELSTVKAHLRDLQNNQLPQKAETPVPAGVSALEHADLRERYQKALKERDLTAAQFETWKQSEGNQLHDSQRVATLEEALRSKDEHLADQAAQVERLLWRVAELEPFALTAPQLEENLRRQESEIAGHVAMHAESSEHIRSLLTRLAELESESGRAGQLQQALAEREGHVAQRDAHISELSSNLTRLAQEHANQFAEVQKSLKERESELADQRTALALEREEHAAHVTVLEQESGRIVQLEKKLSERDAENQGLFAAYSDLQGEFRDWKERALELDKALSDRTLETQQLDHLNSEKDSQLAVLQERITELEPLTGQVQEAEQKLSIQEQRHQTEKTLLRVNSAQRVRRLRQSLLTFKG